MAVSRVKYRLRASCAFARPALATVCFGTLAVAAIAFGAPPAQAQRAAPIERNLPAVVSGQGGLTISQQELASSTDDTPLGIQLSGITLIGPKESVARRSAAGIRIGAIGDINRSGLEASLAPLLGQPLSLKRIGDIQAAIAKVYRAAGYPFVSVLLPPQEVTGGVLVLQVVEFRTGSVEVKGVEAGEQADLVRRVRTAPGDRIAASALDEDLTWLNRYPYRSVNGVFSPGADLGLSTLTLEVTQRKPWQVFAGWSNTGTHSTGFDRYYAGFGAALLGMPESFLSYQVTGSPNFWTEPSAVGSGADQPNYFSQAARIVVSTGPRQNLEVVPNYVATRQNALGSTFAFDSTTLEIPVYYRSAISNFIPGLYAGDLILGASAKSVERTSYFAGENFAAASADLFELTLGWSMTRSDAWGATSFDVRLLGNPGGVLGGNTAADWTGYSAGRVTDVKYVYGAGQISRLTRLSAGFTWVSEVSGTAAGQSLPDTEQLSLGGLYATRGYTLDDATVDTGVVWRNELRMPDFPLLSTLMDQRVTDTVSPYAFFDVSWGRLYGYESALGKIADNDFGLAGVGLGVDYSLPRNFTASLVGGVALSDATYTKAGDVSLKARVYISY